MCGRLAANVLPGQPNVSTGVVLPQEVYPRENQGLQGQQGQQGHRDPERAQQLPREDLEEQEQGRPRVPLRLLEEEE